MSTAADWQWHPMEIETTVVPVPFRETQLAVLQTAIKRLHSGQTALPQVAVQGELKPPVQPELKAMPTVLPGRLQAPANWDEWYQRIARAIYQRWKQNSTGPGSAILTITVFNSRDVDSKVTEFVPALDAERNAQTESAFKDVALKSVSSLSGDDIWQFPASAASLKHIVFDMELKHAVGETAGCKVVHMHDGAKID